MTVVSGPQLGSVTKLFAPRLRRLLVLVWVLLAGCTGQSPPAEDAVSLDVSMPGSPYSVEFKAFAFPKTAEGMNHLSYGLRLGRDGYLYVGIGNNRDDSYLYRFDRQTEHFTELGNLRSAVPVDAFENGIFGKLHAGPYQDIDGTIWIASLPAEWKFWAGGRSGRLFSETPATGLIDRGPTPGNQGVYFMTGDDRHRQLYLATTNSHFLVFDLWTLQWRDKGKFSSKAPLSGLFDRSGRLFIYGYDGKRDWEVGPTTITRYDPLTDTLETSHKAPPTLWVGAVTTDGETAYTSTYLEAELYRWRFDQWPDYVAEPLGRIDPRGRAVFSNNMSLTCDNSLLVVAGTVESARGNEHGIWLREIATGKNMQVAKLNEAMSRSMGIRSQHRLLYWTNANTVDANDWIWIGVHTMPPDATSVARLVGVHISKKRDASAANYESQSSSEAVSTSLAPGKTHGPLLCGGGQQNQQPTR